MLSYWYVCVYHTAIGSSERNIRSIIASDCLSDYKPQLFPELPDILLKFFALHGSIMNNQEIIEYLSQQYINKSRRKELEEYHENHKHKARF